MPSWEERQAQAAANAAQLIDQFDRPEVQRAYREAVEALAAYARVLFDSGVSIFDVAQQCHSAASLAVFDCLGIES